MKKTNPIGIFDSGIGGLTVGHQITKLMPNERIVYFGDTQHLPYGDKSAEAIKNYSKSITKFLLEHKCKMIVIACNTASALAFKEVKDCCLNLAIPLNVIDPIVNYTCSSNAKKVGIIGTKNTIASDIYAAKIQELNNKISASSLATPLLVPMIEEGFYKNKISNSIIANYLSNNRLSNIDHLILGCTHYPLIEEEIRQFYGGLVTIVNSAKIVSQFVKKTLLEFNLLATEPSQNSHNFFVSDYTDSFEQSAQYFFGERINLVEVKL
jgi:glutamate racemase